MSSITYALPTPGRHRVVEWSEQSNSLYHSDRGYLSNSAIGYYLKSPRLYGMWLSGQWTPEVTKPMRMGSAVDGLICGTFGQEMAVRPNVDRRTKVGKAQYQEFLDTLGEREEVTEEEYQAAAAMARAARDHMGVRALLDNPEVTFQTTYFCELENGVAWKGKLDGYTPRHVIELKTCVPPDRFARHGEDFAGHAARRGWYRQAWLYRRLAAMHEGVPDEDVRHTTICIGNQSPHDVHLYEYEEDFLQMGGAELQVAAQELITRRDLGALDIIDTDITTLGVPPWLRRNHT